MQATRQRGERFFFWMGLVLTAIVIVGFTLPAINRPGGLLGIPALLHVHGAVFLAWFVLFCNQARLIGAGNVGLHQRLGIVSVLLALSMIALSFFVMRGAYMNPQFRIAGMDAAGSLMFPFTDIVNFSIAYGLAIANRTAPDAHKRLMLLAGILIIDPAASRLVLTLGGPVPLILGVHLGLFAALIAYDVRTRKRPHWATVLGLGLFAAALVAKLTVANTSGWSVFVERLFG